MILTLTSMMSMSSCWIDALEHLNLLSLTLSLFHNLSLFPLTAHPQKKQRSATTTTTATITDSGSSSSRSNLFASRADLTTKEYQLEELEDREECETELWLNDDGSVTLGETNGPLYKSYHGDWHVIETASEDDKPFRMRLTRTYDASSRWVILRALHQLLVFIHDVCFISRSLTHCLTLSSAYIFFTSSYHRSYSTTKHTHTQQIRCQQNR